MLRTRFVILMTALVMLGCGGDDKKDPADQTNTDQMDTDQTDGSDGTDGSDTPDGDMPQDQPDGDMITAATVLHDIYLDDDVLDYAFIPYAMTGYIPEGMAANHFVPPAAGTLEGARIVIANGGSPTGFLEVTAYAADGPDGAPGTELLTAPRLVQASQTPAFPLGSSAAFLDVDLSDANIEVGPEGFFIAVRFVAGTEAETPWIGMDANSDPAPSWIKTPNDDWARVTDALMMDPLPFMIRATVEVPESSTPDEVILSSAPRDCVTYQGGILPDHVMGQWAAIRLEAPATPFEVTAIRYELRDGMNMAPFPPCSATLPHRVGVFVGGAAPDANPTFAAEYDVALQSDDLSPEMTPVRLEVDPPIVLQAGEYLYIAVEMPGDNPRACIGICGDTADFDHNWLTGSVDPPFTWTNFDTIPAQQDATHRAYGRVLLD